MVEGEAVQESSGRKKHPLRLNQKKYYVIGISLERGCCVTGLMQFGGGLAKTEKLYYEKEIAECSRLLERIDQQVDALSGQAQGELLGIGICAPGPIHPESGAILNPPDFEEWKDVNIRVHFEEKYQVPVFFDNDANAVARAERYFGIGQKYSNYLELLLDTGVGGGIILNGMLAGRRGLGGQIGHATIDIHGERCECGNIGCGELYASIPKIVRRSREFCPELKSWEVIVEYAQDGNRQAKRVIQTEAKYLAAIALNVANILNLDAVILGGKIAYQGQMLADITQKEINTRFIGRAVHQIPVVLSGLPKEEKTLAACNLVMEGFVQQLLIEAGEDSGTDSCPENCAVL